MVLIMSFVGVGAAATDTSIGAKVCGDNPQPASVQITEPNDDSVTSQPTVTVRGTIERTSQVVIDIDGTYNNTVAIASDQTVFATDVTLSKGTHTVSVTAKELCGGPDGRDEIVLTYEPAVQPSTGGVTPTNVEPSPEQGGVFIGDAPIEPEDQPSVIDQIPLIGAAVNAVQDFTAAIGLESTVLAANTPVAVGVARVGVTVVALTSVVMAGSLAPIAAQAVPGVSELFNVTSHRSMIYLGWVIRGIGLLAMGFAYFL